MLDEPIRTLTLVSAVGSGLAAGVFFAFSAFVMKALSRLPSSQGLAAMQAINTAAPTPWFMTALFGTAATCLALGVTAVLRFDEPGAALRLAGSALFLGTIVLTIAYHVPRNDALAVLDPGSAGAADAWTTYVRTWTAWNHLRTLLALGGATLLSISLRAG